METEKFSPHAKDIYKKALAYVVNKEHEVREKGKLAIGGLFEMAKLIVDATEQSEQLNSFAIYYYDTADITRSHVVNVAIFATVLARGLGYSDDELIRVCASALLHDIGISKMDSAILNKMTRHLKHSEITAMKNHSGFGYEIIMQSDHRLEEIAKIVYQHHEKGDGSGYPKHLHEDEMLPAAKILSLIDTYEALLHPRDHRDALVPPQGIHELIRQEGTHFSQRLMKILVETISIYPAGCYIQLNSDETAKVVKTNPKFPTRPEIRILTDRNGNPVPHQILDLTQNSLTVINRCIPPPGMTRISGQ